MALAPQRADYFYNLAESRRFAADDPLLAAMETLDKQPITPTSVSSYISGLAKFMPISVGPTMLSAICPRAIGSIGSASGITKKPRCESSSVWQRSSLPS